MKWMVIGSSLFSGVGDATDDDVPDTKKLKCTPTKIGNKNETIKT